HSCSCPLAGRPGVRRRILPFSGGHERGRNDRRVRPLQRRGGPRPFQTIATPPRPAGEGALFPPTPPPPPPPPTPPPPPPPHRPRSELQPTYELQVDILR